MNRFKEIVFVLTLGFLFIATVQISFYISKKPSMQQRIPIIHEASFELTTHPLSLIKELISTELFEVKNQLFLNELHQLTSSKGTSKKLDGVQMDLQQAMSGFFIQSTFFQGLLIHFHSTPESAQKSLGAYYVQQRRRCILFSLNSFNKKTVHLDFE